MYADEAIEPAWAVATNLVQQFLPEAAEPLLSRYGPVCDATALDTTLERLGNALESGTVSEEGPTDTPTSLVSISYRLS